jgi:hypothetical protein
MKIGGCFLFQSTIWEAGFNVNNFAPIGTFGPGERITRAMKEEFLRFRRDATQFIAQ